MNNEKLKNIAKKIGGNFKNSETPTDLYRSFTSLALSQKEYFLNRFEPYQLIKLIIYCWSFKKTNNFDLGDKIINELEFLTLTYHSSEEYLKDCPTCYGAGTDVCSECQGYGTIECDECRGRGKVDCPECDGNDPECEVCDSFGKVYCAACDGYERVDCDHCDEGYVTCHTCDGQTEVETGEILQNIVYIMSWSPTLNFEAKKSEETLGPLVSTDDLIDYEDNYILTNIRFGHNTLDPEVILPDLYYTIDVDDDPPMIVDSNAVISWKFDESKMERLVLGQ